MTPEERQAIESRLKEADAATKKINEYQVAIAAIEGNKTTAVQLNFFGSVPISYTSDQPSDTRRHFSNVCWGKEDLASEIKEAVVAILKKRRDDAEAALARA